MPQDPSAARMMNTLQSSGTPVSQQFISPTTQNNVADPQSNDVVSDQQKLAIFENVLEEVAAQPQASQTQPQPTGSVSKEQFDSGQVAPQELPGGMQYVESEPDPEIPLEVESYLQRVEEQQQQMPDEILAAAKEFQAESTPAIPTQPVKVLPITKEVAEEGKKKSAKFAVRWLVEFSNKISHLFAGKSIYRTD